MKKETARDIAIALIAKSGQNFDGEAFANCEDITEAEIQKIIDETQFYCQKMIDKIEAKYNIVLKNTTAEIIDAIVFE